MEDSIPSTPQGIALALADRLDTLRECFKIGMVPTGSKDPFALRRAAQGVVKILAETRSQLQFYSLFSGTLADFMRERVAYYLKEVCGYRYDEIDVVLANPIVTIDRLRVYLDTLVTLQRSPEFKLLAESHKRIDKILKQASFDPRTTPFEFLALEAGAESELYGAYARLAARGAPIEEAVRVLGPSLDKFFDDVMVLVDDERVRSRRLGLLYTVQHAFSWLGDFTKIVIPGEQKS
jgi:glycyl-tRNA synthetase beta chain